MATLGIEIGGTKLQLALGDGETSQLAGLTRLRVQREQGAVGILQQIESALEQVSIQPIEAVGIGFGGPVDSRAGRIRLSHHIEGWEGFPLVQWIQQRVAAPVALLNDCDAAALGESILGAGRNRASMFYVTVGTGIGGGHVVAGALQGQGRPSTAEIGHLRLTPESGPDEIVEAHCSGLGIANQAKAKLAADSAPSRLREMAPALHELTSEQVAAAAVDGDMLADKVLCDAAQKLGWAIAQMVTLLAPEVVVLGGGVTDIQREFFFDRVEAAARRLAFPPLRDNFDFMPAALGDEVVLHGAICAAHRLIERPPS